MSAAGAESTVKDWLRKGREANDFDPAAARVSQALDIGERTGRLLSQVQTSAGLYRSSRGEPCRCGGQSLPPSIVIAAQELDRLAHETDG